MMPRFARLARRPGDLQHAPSGIRGRQFQRVGARLEVQGKRTVRRESSVIRTAPAGPRPGSNETPGGGRSHAVGRHEDALDRERRRQPQHEGCLGRRADVPGQVDTEGRQARRRVCLGRGAAASELEPRRPVALRVDQEDPVETGRDPRESIPVGRRCLATLEEGTRLGYRRSPARIHDLDPVELRHAEHDRPKVQGTVQLERLGVLQLAAVGSQGGGALREAGEQEAAAGARKAEMPLHHHEFVANPRQAQEPDASDGQSFRIHGPACHGEPRTECDDRRRLVETLERRRGPGHVGDEDRGALPLGHGQVQLAVGVRDPEAQRLGYGIHTRGRPHQVHPRASEGRTAGGRLHGELHRLPQREFHRVFLRSHIPPGRGEASRQRLDAPCFVVPEQGRADPEPTAVDGSSFRGTCRHIAAGAATTSNPAAAAVPSAGSPSGFEASGTSMRTVSGLG